CLSCPLSAFFYAAPSSNSYTLSLHDALPISPLENRLERRHSRRGKLPLALQAVHDAVPSSCGNDRTDAGAPVECEFDRPQPPVHAFRLGHERRLQQDKSPHSDLLTGQKLGGAPEIVERHLLIQPRQDLGMP